MMGTKYQYRRLTEIDIQGVHLERLGEDGWKLMHVSPRETNQGLTVYLFMREAPSADEPSLFDRVFGKDWKRI